jgi:hypothetical protein
LCAKPRQRALVVAPRAKRTRRTWRPFKGHRTCSGTLATMHLQISRAPQHKEHGALYRAVAGTFQGFLAAMTRGWPQNGNRRGHVGNHLFILFTLIILRNQEVLMARKEPHFRSEKTSLHVDVPCSAAARAVAQLGFFSNLIGKLLAAFTLVGAAGFVAVLSEPTSSRLISFAMLGVVPALAARILGWALYQALKSASCSCHIPNWPLPAGRCGRARTNYGRQMKTRSRIAVASLKQGRVKAVRAAFNAGFISAADRRNHAHNEGRRPS